MNSSRPQGLLRSAILGVAAIALAACSGVHPGSAAVVDGESISMDTADNAATAYCKFALTVAAQQGTTAVDAAETRRQSVTDLITHVVAQRLIRERALKIDPNTYVLTDEQKAQIAKAFPGADHKQLGDAIERSQENAAVAVALGEKATGEEISEANAVEVEKAGRVELAKALKASDVSIDPRFGLDDVTKQVADTGSLSVTEVKNTQVDPTKLPVDQRCS